MRKKVVRSRVRFLGLFGIVGVILFFIAFLTLHIFDSNINLFTNYISEYANGPYGWLFFYALIFHGLGNIAISVSLLFSLRESKIGKIGATLFGLASVGIILGALFTMDPSGVALSFEGKIHFLVAALSLILEALSLFFLAYAFRSILAWKPFSLVTLRVAIIGSIFLLIFTFSLFTHIFAGLVERIVFLIFLLWEIMVAWRIFINFDKIIK